MKKIFIAVCFLILGSHLLFSQTHQLNHQKYWYYRWRLRNHFMKLGPEQGETMILNQRSKSFWMGNLVWGDQTMNLGWYLTILATEYHQLSQNQQNTDQTLKELFYALWAINRLDLNAESLYRPNFNGEPNPLPEDLNGYFCRDDVDQEFYTNNLDHFRSEKIYSQANSVPNWHASPGNPDLNQDGEVTHRGSDWNTDVNREYIDITTNGGQSEMSHDQVYTLMVGLAMVMEYVPPTLTYQGMSFQDGELSIALEAEKIFKRILGHCNGTTRATTLNYAWRIKNTVTGNHVNPGGNMGVWSWGVGEASCAILGNTSGGFGYPPISCGFNSLPDNDYYSHNRYSRWNYSSMSTQINLGAPYATSNDNAHMFGLILAMMGVNNTWGPHESGYTVSHTMHHIPLIRQALYGGMNPVSDEYYEYLLDEAPCEGPYMYVWSPGTPEHNSAPYEWSTTDRLLHAERRGAQGAVYEAEYPGLDYMVYHNLYYLTKPSLYPAPYDMVNTNFTTDLPAVFGMLEMGTETFPFNVEAFNSIVASNTINEYGVNPANGNADVTFRAGYSIELKPGFEVDSGATFLAYVDPFECATDNSYHKMEELEDFNGLFLTEAFQPHKEPQEFVEHDFNFDESDPEVFHVEESLANGTEDDWLRVFPNPASDLIQIELPMNWGEESVQFRISDIWGREMMVFNGKPGITELDISNLAPGLYLLSTAKGNGEIQISKKFIKQ